MSFLSRVLDATISPEPKATKVEDQLEAAISLASGAVDPLPQAAFRRLLCQERKRSERSHKSFLLMLVRHKGAKPHGDHADQVALERVVRPLGTIIRETDTLGWFESNHTLGVIFSELGDAEVGAAVKSIESTDLFDLDESKRTALLLKRLIDIGGSAFALILLAPVFAILAALVKLTSKGPVFFRQQRLGQFQVPFAFLKFRSMYVTTDAEIHREYVKDFIAGRAKPNSTGGQQRRVYKITNDPRVTWIGRFMRRTSLDEIPQFWNVLVGEMSLVGPRPPIGYEIDEYELWHRRRLLEAKPGITGLWQVHGRSRTTFDDMVRLDLRYSRMCSPISDLKILLQTPRAVFSGDGAY